ncbi:hypothetical protein FKP32DRAFT_331565 [Trametes sanguinea]|nr:hypothetical protein FKP32DRAFT_331565 [Trametes sanguinea]
MTIRLTVKETVTLLNYLNRQNLDSETELVPLRDRLQKEVGLQGEAEESDNVSGSQAETSGPPPSSAQMVFSLNTASSHAVAAATKLDRPLGVALSDRARAGVSPTRGFVQKTGQLSRLAPGLTILWRMWRKPPT